MAFPVDILDNYNHDELENLSEDYLSYLRCADPDIPEYFSLRDGREVLISLSTVGYVPLYGGDQAQKVLALFAPEDALTAVALYLGHQWWTVDDTVRTSKSSRDGLQQARTLGERVVLYVLNRIIYRKKEMERDEVPFLCHSSSDYAKILWREGEAIGFYSVKPAACKKYLHKYPGDQELLWEVEGVGHWFQRTLISHILKRETARLSVPDPETAKQERTEKSPSEPPAESQPHNSKQTNPEQAETEQTENSKETQPETEEEKNIQNDDAISSKEHEETPVSTRTRSSQLKRPKIGKKVEDAEPERVTDDARIDSIPYKMESKEQIVENFKELIQQLAEDKDETDMTKLQEEISAKPVQQVLHDSQDVMRGLEENAENKEEVDLEPVNGDITKDVYEPQLVNAQEIATEALDTESNLEPGDSDGKSLTTLVSVNMDLEKSFEDSFPDQVLNPEDLETTTHENVITAIEQTEIQEEAFKERMVEKPSESCVAGTNEDLTGNGLPGYTESNSAEECATSDDALTLETASIEETTINVTADTLLRQGPLLVVELQDVALQQQSDGQRSVSGDQSEGSVETDQSVRKSVERGGDSSSEEMETEIPVIDRRGGLRRKARAYKGPAKRRAKLSA
ncbi:soluble lamin-associated protein of 75 kDa isoform X2 [Aquarana catesbeiana]|uniref:soluble lamin-associated protein of 75 kDa isoform X2 n=1 Tax=Aquarana catesbeiana TaxID=8400 RepID=UPI003CC9909B